MICKNEFYLTSNSSEPCAVRNKYFNNCAIYDRTSDKCLNCLDNHKFHNNESACSKLIDQCKNYITVDPILKCEICNDGYYLSEDKT